MKLVTFEEYTEENENLITTATSDWIDVRRVERFSIEAIADVNTPAATDFEPADVTVAANTITETAHGYTTGLKGQFTTVTTLPAGLSLATDYFVIVVDANTYKVATNLANALAGTAVDITDQGVGTHTFTPTALAGGAIKLQKSNDQVNVADVAAATNITADGTVWFEVSAPAYSWVRRHVTLTAGRLSLTENVVVKGYV